MSTLGLTSCLSKWLSERAVVKAKRDAANEVKMAGLITAIDAGSVCVKRGGAALQRAPILGGADSGVITR